MDLVEADPDQGQLFRNGESVLPDDAFLWAINLPLMSGGASMIPAPNRKEAELFARSIREKLYELDQVDYAKSVYAHLWPLNNGEHTRSMGKGNWEAMINWFGQLCAGEVDVAPVALIGHSPEEVEQAKPETMTMHYDRMIVRMVDGEYQAVADGIDGDAFVGKGASFLEAISYRINLVGRPEGEFEVKDESTPADELAGRRVIDLYLTFDPLVHPELVLEANMQNNVGMAFDQVVEETLNEDVVDASMPEVDYKPTDCYEFVGINDHLILDTYVVTKKGMDFVATSLGGDDQIAASSPVSVESALKARAEMEELVSVEFSFAECTSATDEAKGRRLFDVTCTFCPIEHPSLAHAAQEQLVDLAIDLPDAKMGGLIDDFIAKEWPSESVATDDVAELEAEKPAPTSSRAAKPRYANPDNPSETWTGRGKQPAWLQAKIAAGANISDFLIQ
jgi:hypothetical protein